MSAYPSTYNKNTSSSMISEHDVSQFYNHLNDFGPYRKKKGVTKSIDFKNDLKKLNDAQVSIRMTLDKVD